jgi:hypothetical protein
MTNKFDTTGDIIDMPTLDKTESGGEIKMRRTMLNRPGRTAAEIVLAYLPHNTVTPFVTWQRNTDDGSTYWGHYFTAADADEAVADFAKRGY